MACTGISQIFFAISVKQVLRGWGWTLVSGILDLVIGTYLMMYPMVTMAHPSVFCWLLPWSSGIFTSWALF
jgi:uncharacterized membrane protein HdeD (DUF308 family)